MQEQEGALPPRRQRKRDIREKGKGPPARLFGPGRMKKNDIGARADSLFVHLPIEWVAFRHFIVFRAAHRLAALHAEGITLEPPRREGREEGKILLA